MHGFKKKLLSGGLAVCFTLTSVFSPIMVTAASKIQSVPTTTSIYGYDQYETAAKIAQNGWTGTSDYAILAAGMSANLIDALAAGPLAAKVNAPIILTEGNVLNKNAKDQLTRLKVKKVYVTSGTAVIKQSVLDELKTIATVTEVKALGGYDASETSVNIAKAMVDQGAKIDKVIITGGAGSDALSIAPIAGAQGMPILYTSGGSLSSYVLTYLDGIKSNLKETYVIGGTAVVSEAVKTQIPGTVVRYYGQTQYDTNIEVLKQFAGVLKNQNTYVANGETLVDALAGAPLAVKNNSLILLTGKTLPEASKNYAQSNLSTNVIGLGGESVVPARILSELSPTETISLDGSSKGSSDAANLEQLNGSLKVTGSNVTVQNAKTDYSIYVQGDNVTLNNVTVQGTIFLDPGDKGSATLQNVKATNLVILSGADHSINLKDVIAQLLNIQSSSPNVHVNASGSTTFTQTQSSSTAIFEASDGSLFGTISITYSSQSSGVAPIIELRGTFPDTIEVGGGVTVIAAPGSNISNLAIMADDPSQTVTLQGNFNAVEVNSQANVTLGANTTITNVVANALANIVVPPSSAITHLDAGSTGTNPTGGGSVGGTTPPVVTPTPAPNGGGSGGGSNSGNGSGETVVVSAITVTGNNTVVNGETLQLDVNVSPSNATDKDITWVVASLVGGTALIDTSKGFLTAEVVGTVTVTATNAASGITGTLVVTITPPIILPTDAEKIATAKTVVLALNLAWDTDSTTTISTVNTAVGTATLPAGVTAVAAEGTSANAGKVVVTITSGTETDATIVLEAQVPQVPQVPPVATVTFTKNPTDLTLSVTQGTIAVQPETNGTYKLETGDYTYTASKGGYETKTESFSITNADITAGKSITVSQAITVTAPDAVMNLAAIAGIIAPVNGATPVTTVTETDQYTAAVSWSPADGKFGASTAYKATTTLAPKAGYTLVGVPGNFFTVAGATTVTNPANSGVITAVFPATAPNPAIPLSSIGPIVGAARVGSELTSGSVLPIGATYSFQWQRADTADGTYTDITGATSSTYTPVAGDTVNYIKVVATGVVSSSGIIYSGTVTSAATMAIAASGQQTNDSDFKIVDGLLWEYKGADGDVVIPEGVIRVMDDAFAQNTSITSLYFPKSVEYVGNYEGALRGCTKLNSLTFSNTTHFVDTDLNEHASIKELNIYRGGTDSIARNRFFEGASENLTLEKINIGEGITEIGTWEFDNFKALKQVDFPDSLKIIGQNAFSGCENLESVVFPDALETIGGSSFSGCLGLTELIIPKGIRQVSFRAFKDCANLTKLSIPNGLTINGAFEGCTQLNTLHITLSPYTAMLHNIYTDTMLDTILVDEGITAIVVSGQTKLKELHLPNTLEYITSIAGCTNLESITIPSQTYTNPAAFTDCPNLKNITISYKDHPVVSRELQLPESIQTLTIAEGITSTEAWSLNNLHSLTTLLLPDTLIKIESNSFNGCEQLENFRFPKALERLGDDCFKDSVKLTELRVQSSNLSIGENSFINCDQLKTLKAFFSGRTDFRLISNLPIEEVYIGEGFTKVGGLDSTLETVASSSLKKVTLPGSLIEIEDSAFGNCNNLNEINIPSNVTQVGSFAFENCTSLKSIILPDSVTHIQGGAFYGCTGLEHLAISRNVQHIFSDAFSGCTNITKLEIPWLHLADSEGLSLSECYNNLQKLTLLNSPKSMNVVSNTIDAEEIIIEDGFTEIASSSFKNLAKLRKISFPSSIQRIGSDSFENCGNLEELVFPNGLISIGSAFKNCSKLSAVSIPGSVESIGAFDGCESLDTITISNTSLQRLNNKPFYTCRPKTINVLYSAEASAMSGYYLPFADTVNIAEGITSIGSLGYLNGKEIVVPKSVTDIARINADIWRSDYPCPKTMKVYYNSYAHQFALENNVPFSFIDRELEDDAVSGVTIIEESKVILLDSEELLVHEVLPATAGNKNVTWVSSNPEIATVDNFGHVNGLKEGTATITVTTEKGGFQDSCEITVYSPTFPILPKDSIVHRVLNVEGNYAIMSKVSDTNLNLYLENDYFRDTIDKWWNIWMGSNITVNGSTALQLMAFQYTNVKTKAFYEGFYGDLFMNYSEPGTLTKNCAQIIYHLIHNYPDAIIPVNLTLSLPSGVNSDALSLTDLTWYLDRADSEMVFNLLNNYDSVLTEAEYINDIWELEADVIKEILLEKEGLKTTLASYISDNINNASINGIGLTLSALGGIVNLMETQQKLDEGKALYNTTSTSIQRVMDQANLINYYDATSISNMKQSWANTSRDYSNSTLVLNEAGVSGAKWFIDKSYEVGIGNPVITAWNLMISVSSLALNSEIKNSLLFSQYCVGNNILVAAKDVYLTNNVKLTQIRFGQLSVTESEFQDIQNNLRSSVAVMYLVRGQLAAYERELTISFFSDGSALIPSASQSSQWKKLGIDFQDYKNITLNEFIGQ